MLGTPSKDSGTNAIVSVTIPSRGAGAYVEIRQIIFSLSEDPASAVALTVESPSGTVIMNVDVTKGGVGPIITGFRSPTKDAAVLVKLAAGGTGVVGKVNVIPCE